MKTTKKIMTLLLALGITASNMVYADSPIATSADNQILIGNVSIERSYITDDKGKNFLPLKVVGEALGYEVRWFNDDRHVELVKGAQFITIKTNENYYTFSKMAPMKLSETAFIKNGTTYVPVDFISEILHGNIYNNNGNLEITSNIDTQVSTGGFVITKIDKQTIYTTLNEGEAHIILNSDTIIKDYQTGLDIDLSALAVGDTLKVTHPSIMLMIYPPQYNAFEIERINNVAFTEGIIESIQDDSILVKTNSTLIQFNIDKSTKLTGLSNSPITLSSLRIGNSVKVYHSLAMTKSIPPQSFAFEVQVDTSIH